MPNYVHIGAVLSVVTMVALMAYSRWSSVKQTASASQFSTPSIASTASASAEAVWSVGTIVNTPDTCVGSLRLTELLGKGRNSVVFSATKLDGGAEQYAVKVRSAVGDSDGQLTREFEVLSALNSTEGFPYVFCHVPELNVVVMERLIGYKPLTQFEPFGPPPLPITHLVKELIARLESVHNAGYVHVDVHRRNILVNEQTGGVALIDFGLAVAQHEKKNPKYVNLYLSGVHEGAQLPMHPVDDLERLVYVLINQFYSPLPWSDFFKLREKIEADLIEARKARVSVQVPPNAPFQGFKQVLNVIDSRVLTKKMEFANDLNFFTSNSIPLQLRSLLKYAQTWDRTSATRINYSYLRSLFMVGIQEEVDGEEEESDSGPITPANSPTHLSELDDVAPASSTGGVNDP